MRLRFLMSLQVVAILVATGLVVPASVAGQSTDAGWTLPRTPDGHPDLQGVWANNSATPLERPDVWEGKETLTEEEWVARGGVGRESPDCQGGDGGSHA